VAPNLNEQISELVWKETMEQSEQMVEFMISQPGGASRQSVTGVRSIAINVLGQVAYGQSMEFRPVELPKDPKAKFSYVDAISLCVENIIFASLIPTYVLKAFFMPTVLRTVGSAREQLPDLAKDMLQAERKRIASGSSIRENIMSMLVRLSDKGRAEKDPSAAGGQYLTEEEIAGNMFLFTAAGFDTTANSLAYAITVLAAYPEYQVWVQEELDFVLNSLDQTDNLDYAAVFPRLTRCLAVMVANKLSPFLTRSRPLILEIL
jgi:cytochrome P450